MNNIIKEKVPKKLKKRNLSVNDTKTEEYTVKRNGDDRWKKCKNMGSSLNTEEDVKRRKQLAMNAFLQHKPTLQSPKVSLKTRISIFNAYVTSVFMYNSELWGMTATLEKEIDVFHRKLLRQILKIKCPYIITSEAVYDIEQKKSNGAKR